MSFKFDSFTGQLSQAKAFNTERLLPASKEASPDPVFKFESSKVKPVQDMFFRKSFATSSATQSAATAPGGSLGEVPKLSGYQTISRFQKSWGIEDGHYVWQKRGFQDRGPFWLTYVFVGLGIGYGVFQIYKMSFPKKAE